MGKKTIKDFIYCDVHWDDPASGKRSNRWKRILIDEVPEFQQKNSNYNVFSTVQQFQNPVYNPPELVYMPLYFDLDSSITFENMDETKNWHANLNRSKNDAIKIRDFFSSQLGITNEDIRFYFSGNKGFHILVSPIALGIEPTTDLHLVFKYIALYLKELIEIETLDYGSIYSSRRMLRIVDSVHQKSRLFKIELEPSELDLEITEIISLAKSPRGSLYENPINNRSDVASRWFSALQEDYNNSKKVKTKKSEEVLEGIEELANAWPECVKDIYENGIRKPGDRNKATMALASFFKNSGIPENDCIGLLIPWVKKIKNEHTSASPAERKASTVTAIKCIYSNEKYHFDCPFILSLRGEDTADEDLINCGGKKCPIHSDYKIGKEPGTPVHLSDSAKADFTGKKIQTNVLVSGKLDTPYIVPKKVRYTCRRNPETCEKPCILADYNGLIEKEFAENDRILIEATNQNDNHLKGVMKKPIQLGCKEVSIKILDYVNIEELLVVPMAERVISIQNENKETIEVDETGKEYVARKIYYVGNRITTNQYYTFEGYVYPHPKNQFGTILSSYAKPLQDSIDNFELTPEIIEDFKIFQKQKGEEVADRIDTILDDITNNVTLVWERYEALLAILLTYHSVLSFDFQHQRIKRGWLETLLIGDTGQAKTQLVQYFQEYAGLGELASGEMSSRTGLIYRLEQLGERWFIIWGKYPLNDRKLLIIDELAALNPEDLGRMTESRSTGVLKVDRAVNTETNARTRLLFLSNPRYGKQLCEYTHGIESLKHLFEEASDIRRLDLAVFFATKDVPKDVLNKKFIKPESQLISSETMKNSIRWIWSRTPEDVVITDAALEKILLHAKEISEIYGPAEDIPLISPADERVKLARKSIALAGLLHSADESHQKIIVLPEHVDYIRDFIELIYNAKNCRYDIYAKQAYEEGELLDSESAEIKNKLYTIDIEDAVSASEEIIELFSRNDTIKNNELMELTGYSREVVSKRLKILTHHKMIKRTRNGLKKLPKFLDYLAPN